MTIRHKQSGNKEKLGTVLDRNLISKIKERSAREGRTISDIIQDALKKYNEIDLSRLELRKAAVDRFCSRPFNLDTPEIDEILKEDIYEV